MGDSRRIAKNTLILYIRMFFVMVITIYTSRVVLATLGVEDYGIYNAVGGIVGLFTIISGSLSNSVMRFITFELGKGDKEKLKVVFLTSNFVMLLLSCIFFVVAESVGVWFLNCKMNIPTERMTAANWVLQCSLLMFVVNLLSVPYNAIIIAHERMNVFAFISMFEVVLKLAIVYVLRINGFDRLVLYAILLLIVAIIIRLFYWWYCRSYFEECHYHHVKDKHLFKNMISFAGWNFLGQGTFVLNTQGVSILMNVFFGVVVNAARGIAGQVQSAVNQFVNSFSVALNPQITKSYASGDLNYMHSLIYRGTKITYILTLLLTLPLCMEAETVLKIWLGSFPEHTVSFMQLTLIAMTVQSIGGVLTPAIHATGKLKKFMLVIGAFEIGIFITSLIAYLSGSSPEAAYYAYIIGYAIMLIARVLLLKDLIKMDLWEYCKHVYLPIIYMTIPAIIPQFILVHSLDASYLRLVVTIIVSSLSISVFGYLLGMDVNEKTAIKSLIMNKIFRR